MQDNKVHRGLSGLGGPLFFHAINNKTMKKTSVFAKRRIYVDSEYGHTWEYAKINAYGCNPWLPEGYELVKEDLSDWSIDVEINQIGKDDLAEAIDALLQVEKLYQERVNEIGFLRNEIRNMRGAISAFLNDVGETRVVTNNFYVGRNEDASGGIVIEPIKIL